MFRRNALLCLMWALLFFVALSLNGVVATTPTEEPSPTPAPAPTDPPTSTPTPPTSPPTKTPTPPTKSPTQAPTPSTVCPDDPRDRDGDGITDCNDKCADDFNKATPGICGCGVSDTLVDSNRDGIPECQDEAKTIPSMTGYGAPSDATRAILSNLAFIVLFWMGHAVIQN